MNELKIFNNEEFGQVRMVQIDNEPWFVGKDIAKSLGYANTRVAIQDNVDDCDKGVTKVTTSGGLQETTVINESGMYALVFGSRKESAKRFKHWVTSEILPSIRKHGVYAIDEVLQNPDMLISALQNLKAEREKNKELEQTVQKMDKVICDMTPKVDYADRILSSNDCMTVSQIAQDYGMSAKSFNKLLYKVGIQHKVGEQWILYAEHQGKGYVKNKTCEYTKANGTVGTKLLTVWKQKGRLLIYEKLKNIGVLPEMELAQ